MKWVRTALVASPMLFGTLCGSASLALGADTRPTPGARDDWYREDEPTRDRTPETGRTRDTDKDLDRELDRTLSRRDIERGRDGDMRQNDRQPPTDYPGRDTRDWVFASTNAATARALFHRAENEIAVAYRRAQQVFQKSKDYKDAQTSEKEAYDAYNAARSHALHGLADNSRYRTLLHLRDELGERLAQRRAAKDISRDEVVAMATLKMEYASDARALEVEALSQDGNIKAARDKMVAASGKTTQMRADFDESLRDNPRILAARRNLEDARIALISAEAFYNGVTTSANAALDYAYYLHRNDTGRYDYAGNGGPWSTPYWVRY